MLRRLLALPLSVGFLLACSAEPLDEPRFLTNQQPIAGGQADNENVNVFGMYTQSGQGGGMCTGTLIAPNLLLTARHCVAPNLSGKEYVICGESGFGNPYPGQNVYITNDIKLSQYSTSWFQGSEIRVPVEGNDTCGFDVALIILGSNVDNVTPAIPRIDRDVEVGEVYSAVGYGTTGAGYGGSRMIRTGLVVQCTPGNCPGYSGVQATEWGGETGVCQGDSGGPAFDEDNKVIGVVSRGLQGCDSPTYGSVSAWRDFLIEVATEAALKGGYEPPFWLNGSSDPENPIEPNPEPEPVTSAQGQGCGKYIGCPEGFGCYTPSGDQPSFCAQFCDPTTACSTGTQCLTAGAANVCAPAANAEESPQSAGCSVTTSDSDGPMRPVPWLVGAALALFGLRRRGR